MNLKNQLVILITGLLSFIFSNCEAQVKNTRTNTAKVYGNCGMCKKTIETAANQKGIVKAKWSVETNILSFTYDSTMTYPDEILKRVADAGYDNEKFTAPDEAYNNLHQCCQYERAKK